MQSIIQSISFLFHLDHNYETLLICFGKFLLVIMLINQNQKIKHTYIGKIKEVTKHTYTGKIKEDCNAEGEEKKESIV